METIISVKDLKKNYGKFEAVKGISFDVYSGEIFGLLGPNGAGKSTTLEIIETLRDKTSGKVIVDGLDLDKSPEKIKKIIGVQLQTSGFYPGLNLLELIDLFCGLYNTSTDSMKLLEMVNLKDKAKNKYQRNEWRTEATFFHRYHFNQPAKNYFFRRTYNGPGSAGATQFMGTYKADKRQRNHGHYYHSLYG